MVQAQINIDEKTNRILNMVKAQYGLKDKSEAIQVMAIEYEKEVLEFKVKPSFAAEIDNVKKNGKFVDVKDFRKRYGLN